jgi:hypothetical protein
MGFEFETKTVAELQEIAANLREYMRRNSLNSVDSGG